MKPVEATELPAGQTIRADCCVVGAGPAGLTIAASLARAGISVCLVESGHKRTNQRAQALDALECVGHPIRSDFTNRLRVLGGTTNLWAGRCMALDTVDFEPRDWVLPGGWPLPYQEYRYYLQAAAELMALPPGFVRRVVAGTPDPIPDAAAIDLSGSELAQRAALWAERPPRFWEILGPPLSASRSCRVITGLSVTGMRLNAGGDRVSALRAAATKTGGVFELQAQQFVLASGGIESTRLLLLGLRENPQARLSRRPLGRFYMDHPRIVYGRIRLRPGVDLGSWLGRPVAGGMVQAGVGLGSAAQRAGRWLNVYCYLEQVCPNTPARGYDAGGEVMERILLQRGRPKAPVGRRALSEGDALIYRLTPRELLPHWLYRRYHALRVKVKPHRRDLVIVNHCEQMPDPDSRITLSDALDRFGNPLPRLDWRIHSREIESMAYLQQRLGAWLEQRGLGCLHTDPSGLDPAMVIDSSHHIGGTRMSRNPDLGVTGPDLKVHGIDNLFVCGSSTFPSAGCVNPTWSIVAFALRLGDHLARAAGKPTPRASDATV